MTEAEPGDPAEVISPNPELVWRVIERHPPLLDRHVFRLREHVAVHPISGRAHTFSVIEGGSCWPSSS
jgi:hypothetical protein